MSSISPDPGAGRDIMTPPELARKYRVAVEKILGFIATGQLRALDVSSRTSSRPRWRITAAAIAEFEAAHSSKRPPAPTKRRRGNSSEVTPFF
jgi:hypothetical protein